LRAKQRLSMLAPPLAAREDRVTLDQVVKINIRG